MHEELPRSYWRRKRITNGEQTVRVLGCNSFYSTIPTTTTELQSRPMEGERL